MPMPSVTSAQVSSGLLRLRVLALDESRPYVVARPFKYEDGLSGVKGDQWLSRHDGNVLDRARRENFAGSGIQTGKKSRY